MKIIGHRGAKGLAPENTLAAVQAALAVGVDAIEIDVRLTADGIPVVVHNPYLLSSSGSRISIAQSTYAELTKTHAALPTLDNIVRSVNRHVPVIVEVKRRVPVQEIVRCIQTLQGDGWKPEDMWLASKDFGMLRLLHANLPEYPCIVIDAWSGVRATWRARRLGTRRIAMNSRFMWSGFIRAISRKHELYAYTVNDPSRLGRWQSYGMTGIITDYPDRMK